MNKRTIIILVGLILIIILLAVDIGILRRTQRNNSTQRDVMTCGGIAGLECPENYVCYYSEDANFPDAAGECIPQYVDRGSVTNGSTPQRRTYTNSIYNFSVDYPNDWSATTYSPVETRFESLTGDAIKFYIFDFSDAPKTAAEVKGPTFTQDELKQKKTAIAEDPKTQTINDIPVYLSVEYDKAGMTFIRKAEFFIDEDAAVFSMPVFSNSLPDGKFVVDIDNTEQLNEMIRKIEAGEAGSDAAERVKIFDDMIATLTVQ